MIDRNKYITYPEYMKYVRFAFGEELERLGEYLYGIENNIDQRGDKYYVEYPNSCCPPDYEYVCDQLETAGRVIARDFKIIDSEDDDAQCYLLDELTELLH